MHLRDGIDQVIDEEGAECSFDCLARKAIESARDIIAGEAKAGRIKLSQRIDVEDEERNIVHSLSFADAVEIVGP